MTSSMLCFQISNIFFLFPSFSFGLYKKKYEGVSSLESWGVFHWAIFLFLFFLSFFFFFCFLGLHLQHMVVLRLEVKSEWQLLATATRDLSHICDLLSSSWQCQTFNPLSRARDQTCNLIDINWVCYCWTTTGTPHWAIFLKVEK